MEGMQWAAVCRRIDFCDFFLCTDRVMGGGGEVRTGPVLASVFQALLFQCVVDVSPGSARATTVAGWNASEGSEQSEQRQHFVFLCV